MTGNDTLVVSANLIVMHYRS